MKNIFLHYNRPTPHTSFLTTEEEYQLLFEWNKTNKNYQNNKLLHQLFEEQAKKTPHNIAAEFEGVRLTYKELNEKANQLAHYLREEGVEPDTLVAISIERSLEMLIGLLGVLKAGGAYVPLDSSHPPNYLQFMLKDSKAPILLTQTHLRTKLKNILSSYLGKIVNLDQAMDAFAHYGKNALRPGVFSAHLAYVIYTSGSTGTPKGVLGHHSAIINRFFWMWELYPFSAKEEAICKTSLSFVDSIWEIFGPLLKGIKLLIVPNNKEKELSYLMNLLSKDSVKRCLLVPSLLNAILQSLQSKEIINIAKKRKLFVVSGEPLQAKVKELFEKIFPNAKLLNLYGSSEVAADVTYHMTAPDDPSCSLGIIGRPISNTNIHILDSYLNPVPIGITGEIYVGGAGLARGYLNRPELTAERFIPNPFQTEEEREQSKNSRLYKTGDLAKYLTNGDIEFLGRADNQVKIRGYRIELEGIESILNGYKDVSQAVIVTKENQSGDKKLIAYIALQEKFLSSLLTESTFTLSLEGNLPILKGKSLLILTEDLRKHLGRSFPDYMIPSFFLYVKEVPLNPNGKIDRNALPAPDFIFRQVSEQYVAPTSPIEKELASIWSEILKINEIGIHDNFFKLGGHSLLATQVISRIRNIYQIDLPFRSFFEHPSIHTLSQDIKQLVGEKRLSFIPPLSPHQTPDSLPLSFAQQRLWFLDQLLPNIALYNIPLSLRLIGPIHLGFFEKAFNSLIERHESLRTIFSSIEGEAQQLILPLLSLNIADFFIDLSSLSQETQEDTIKSLAFEEANAPFNLSTGPLIRVKLLKLSPQDHVLFITIHHIISDGWSMGIFFKEFSFLYNAYLREQEATLDPLPIQYTDFALWQRRWLQGEALEAQLSYWQQQLEGIPDLLELPTDRQRPKEPTYKGANYHYALSKEIKDQLNHLSQQQGVSLFMTLLAFFQVLLYRYTGQKDIVVGSPIANRHYKEVEGLIGFFVNTLALRTSFKGNEIFRDVLKQVKEATLQAYQYQDVPFEHLVDHLNIARVFNRNPIFQVLFVLQNIINEEGFSLENVLTSPAFTAHHTAKFDLSVSVSEYKEGISIDFEYATDLFEEETIKGLAQHFERVVEQGLRDPSVSINEISILTLDEEKQILIDWNDTEAKYQEKKTIHQLFEEQVERTPNNTALIHEEIQLTYRELNDKANQLAHYITQSHDIKPDTLIALFLDRSEHMIIGILAVLKSGGAYVPIDPTYPDERIGYILKDTNTQIILTNGIYKKKLENINTRIKAIAVDELALQEDLRSQPTTNLRIQTTSAHLAYVIYTSGTTGNPKGVMTNHKGIVNTLLSQLKYLTDDNSIKEIQSFGLFVNYVFDSSISSIFLPLMSGRILTSISNDSSKKNTFEFFLEKQVNAIIASSSSLILLEKIFSSLKVVIIGGDSPDVFLTKKLVNLGIKVYQEYGLTESSIASAYKQLHLAKNVKNIGTPISNTKCYILDSALNVLPIGAVGELYVGGVGLARGYLNRADLTAERFIPNPFQTEKEREQSKNSRLYKTGDLVRWLPDGNLEYIGRNDFQVKIRGYRIELSEIENVLSAYEGIKQSVVLVKEHKNEEESSSNKYLVGYYVSEAKLDEEKLRRYMQAKLPEYMVPTFFVCLEKLPLTINGKLDRKALPDPEFGNEESYVAPRNELEKQVCKIWEEVLNLPEDKVGIHDDFFQLGGNSILAIKLVSKLNKKFNHGIRTATIFKNNTPERFSCYLNKDVEDRIVINKSKTIKAEDQKLSFAQERLWFIERYEEGTNAYNVPMVFKILPSTRLDILEKSIRSIVTRHEILRTLIKEDAEGNNYQLVVNDKENPLTIEKVNIGTQTELDETLSKRVNHIYDLSHEYPLKVSLYELTRQTGEEDKEYFLSIIIHHIAFDGWSVDIFLKELQTYYDYYLKKSQGLEVKLTLPDLEIQYKDFSLWQRSYLSGERLDQQLNYWRNKLEGYETLSLITDKPRPSHVSYKGAEVYFELDEGVSRKLRGLAKELKVSLYSLLLSGYYLMLRSYSNQEDLVIGTAIANRHYNQVENLIGLFVNSLALRAKIDPKSSVKEFIQYVGDGVKEAQLHQDLPFEKLVEELSVTKDTSRHPIFQIMFDVQDFGSELYQSANKERKTDLKNLLQIYGKGTDAYKIAKFDISTFIDNSHNCLRGTFDYAISLYTEETISRFVETYLKILRQLAELAEGREKQEQTKIADLEYLNTEQHHQIIHTWNATEKDYPNDKTLFQLFEEQVEQTPGNIALIYEETQLTYRELNNKANQLAHYITQNHNIKPDTLIALCLDRNEHMLIGILAVLKSGGAYVPIDPSYPDERIGYILKDTNTQIVLTNGIYKQTLENLSTKIKAIAIDEAALQEDLRTQPTSNLRTQTTSAHLAYVIYTSGTTGNPKGVMVNHMGVVNYIFNVRSHIAPSMKDKIDFSTNIGFDLTITTTICGLCLGSQIVIYAGPLQDIEAYKNYLIKNNITTIKLVPSYFELLLECLPATKINKVILGGEKLNAHIVKKLKSLYQGKQEIALYDEYGPTETTVGTCNSRICLDSTLTIGKPYHNYKTYVLDSALNALPIGAVGELYVGGVGLARGYLNRPDLTAERFIPNPFQTKEEEEQSKNSRIYKTGDLVRWLPEGNLEYIGRNDFQVKIRGYRIELSEIETALEEHGDVSRAVVIAKEDESRDKKLIAYIVPSEFTPSASELKEFLARKLPEYMIPTFFVCLEKLPLTINGKLDRSALPDPEFGNEEGYVAPRNELEKQVCKIWAEVLNLPEDKVGIHDDFFQLGGDSITAIRLTNKLNKTFVNKDIQVACVFKNTDIEKLAHHLENNFQSIRQGVEYEF